MAAAAGLPGRLGVERAMQAIKGRKHVETLTCSDFNTLAESSRPEAIRYADNDGRWASRTRA